MMEEMYNVVNQLLAIPHFGSEPLFNTTTKPASQLSRAITVFKHMSKVKIPECRPSMRTDNILFIALLSRRKDTDINHMYMDTMKCPFRQMPRTNNARELFNQMKENGFTASGKTYYSLLNALALGGEVHEALAYLWEMMEKQKPAYFITYNTLLDEFCRKRRAAEALSLLKEF